MKRGQKEQKAPTLNPNSIRATLEEVYNSDKTQQKANLRQRIDRALIDSKPAEYAPLTSNVDSLKSGQLSPEALKEIVSDMASTKRDLTKESNKKEDRNQARIAELEARYEKLKARREAESNLANQIKTAQKVVNDKLREDWKITKEKYAELVSAHKKSENKKEKLETEGINSFLQMLNDLTKDAIKFVRIHNLFAKMITESLNEFTQRFNDKMEEVDVIFQSFSLGRFLMSFSRRENLPATPYLTDYINSIVTARDCSINTASKERMREIFVNFMLSSVDCLLILCNGASTRLTFDDMLCYYTTVYSHMFGRDQSFVDLMSRYNKEIEESSHKKKEADDSSAEESPASQ